MKAVTASAARLVCGTQTCNRGVFIILVMRTTNEQQPRLHTGNTAFTTAEAEKAVDTLKVLYPGIFKTKLITRRLWDRPIYTIRVFSSPALGVVRVAHARSRNPFAAAMQIIDRIDSDPDFSRRVNPAFAE